EPMGALYAGQARTVEIQRCRVADGSSGRSPQDLSRGQSGRGGGGCGADGDRQWLLPLLHVGHLAAPIQDSPGLDHQAGRAHLAPNDALRKDFHAPLGGNHALKTAAHDHMVPVDFALDAPVFSDDDGGVRDDCAFHLAVNAESSGQLDAAFQDHAFVEKADPLTGWHGSLSVQKLHSSPPRRALRFYRGQTAVSRRNMHTYYISSLWSS